VWLLDLTLIRNTSIFGLPILVPPAMAYRAGFSRRFGGFASVEKYA